MLAKTMPVPTQTQMSGHSANRISPASAANGIRRKSNGPEKLASAAAMARARLYCAPVPRTAIAAIQATSFHWGTYEL